MSNKSNNNQFKQYLGEFWLPEQEDKKVIGELTISLNGFYIRTVNSLGIGIFSNEPINVVFGIVKDNENYITHTVILYDLFCIHSSSSKIIVNKYFINICLINPSSSSVENTKYISIQLFSDVFSSIILKHNFKQEPNRENNTLTTTYHRPENIVIFDSKTIKLSIIYEFDQTQSRGSLNMSESTSLLVETRLNSNLDYFLIIRQKVERWIAAILGIDFKFDTGMVLNTNQNKFRIYQHREHPDYKVYNYDSANLLIQLQKTFGTWLSLEDSIYEATNTFFFAFSDYKLDIYSKFLNYIISLEKLHRIDYSNNYILNKKDQEFNVKFKNLKIDGDLKSWIAKQLKKEKVVYLSNRLNDLVNFTKLDLINPVNLLSKKDIQRIVDTRHYLAHLDENQKTTMFQSREILRINEQLEDLFLTFIRMKIGISKNQKANN